MNYELAKQLRDAGYQVPKRVYTCWVDKNDSEYILNDSGIFKGYKGITETVGLDNELRYLPTLSELIEACGESFVALSKTTGKKWSAHKKVSETEMEANGEYSTPEEAVARLWLELNKK